MAAEFITRRDFEDRFTNFTAYIHHAMDEQRVALQREIKASEQRIYAYIDAVEQRLNQRIDKLEERLDRTETVGKQNTQMLNLILEQLSVINKKLGIN